MRSVNKHVDQPHVRGSFPKSIVDKSRLTWWLWLIPAGAVAICAWFFYRDFVAAGPAITIYFDDAEGVQTKDTMIMYRGVNVGVVKSVELSKDTKKVKLNARLTSTARGLARQGSTFWIVRPEVKMGSITGLRTIVTGEYVAVLPGEGPPTNVFHGVARQPIAPEPGSLEITLDTPVLGSLQERSPIFYRGVQVGEILYYQLESDAHRVVLHGRIREQYAPLVRANSVFWNAGGIDMHLGLFKGFQISAESARTLISGGIEFATPPESGARAVNGATFLLHAKYEDKWKSWAPTIDLQLSEQAAETNNTPTPAALLKQPRD